MPRHRQGGFFASCGKTAGGFGISLDRLVGFGQGFFDQPDQPVCARGHLQEIIMALILSRS